MAKVKNQVFVSSDQDKLSKLAEEFRFIGREVVEDYKTGKITILALPRKYKKKVEREKKLEAIRKARHAYDFDEDEGTEDRRYRED